GARAQRGVRARLDGGRPGARGGGGRDVPARHRDRARPAHVRRDAGVRGVCDRADRSVARARGARRERLARPLGRSRVGPPPPRRGIAWRKESPGYAAGVAHGSIDELEAALREADYLPDRGLATALYLALALEKPVLLE